MRYNIWHFFFWTSRKISIRKSQDSTVRRPAKPAVDSQFSWFVHRYVPGGPKITNICLWTEIPTSNRNSLNSVKTPRKLSYRGWYFWRHSPASDHFRELFALLDFRPKTKSLKWPNIPFPCITIAQWFFSFLGAQTRANYYLHSKLWLWRQKYYPVYVGV